MEKISKEKILSDYEWLQSNSISYNIIMGDDLDAALSTVLYLHLNPLSKVVGVYKNYCELHFSKDYFSSYKNLINSSDTIWIDLDIYSNNCHSIGHHIVRYSTTEKLNGFKNSINLNELLKRSITNKFSEKYPLGTIHFLMWLYGIEIPMNKYADKLIWLADSAFINSQSHRFRGNAKKWIENVFPVKSLIDDFNTEIESIEFEKGMSALQNDMIQNNFSKGKGQVKSKNLRLTGFQCQSVNLPGDIINLLDYVSNITGWVFKKEQIRLDKLGLVKGKRIGLGLSKFLEEETNLDEFLSKNKIFSYVFPYKYNINYTIF